MMVGHDNLIKDFNLNLKMSDYNEFAEDYERLTEKMEQETREHTYSLISISR